MIDFLTGCAGYIVEMANSGILLFDQAYMPKSLTHIAKHDIGSLFAHHGIICIFFQT